MAQRIWRRLRNGILLHTLKHTLLLLHVDAVTIDIHDFTFIYTDSRPRDPCIISVYNQIANWIRENLHRDASNFSINEEHESFHHFSSFVEEYPSKLAVKEDHESIPFSSDLVTSNDDGYRRRASLNDLIRDSSSFVSPRLVDLSSPANSSRRRMSMRNGLFQEQDLDSDDEIGVDSGESPGEGDNKEGEKLLENSVALETSVSLTVVPDDVNVF